MMKMKSYLADKCLKRCARKNYNLERKELPVRTAENLQDMAEALNLDKGMSPSDFHSE